MTRALHEPMGRLTALRPEPRWADGEDAALLAGILAAEPAARAVDVRLTLARPRLRRRAVLAVVAAGIAAAVALPIMLPGDAPGGASPAAAAALHRLAGIAVRVPPADDPRPGQFRHLVKLEKQASSQGRMVHRIETWTAADGRMWQRDELDWDFADDTPGVHSTETFWTRPSGQGSFGYPTPAFLRSLPTEPRPLRDYLLRHVTGSSSKDEAVFVAIGDMLRWGYAPPALRAAAVEAMALSRHVSLGPTTRDPLGRAVQEFRFVDERTRPGEVTSLLFDVHTVQIVGETTQATNLTFRSTVETADVVDAVPADVLRTAVPAS